MLSRVKILRQSNVCALFRLSRNELHSNLQSCFSFTHCAGSSQRFSSKKRADPFTRRPSTICDPYGQGGQPLLPDDATRLLESLDNEWQMEHEGSMPPISIFREFNHPDYLSGAKFVHHMACVGEINNHYPIITLERRLLPRQKVWLVVTTVKCKTEVLQGLSHNDFHLAMLMDVELARPEVRAMLVANAGIPGSTTHI